MATVYTWNVNVMDVVPSKDGFSDVVKVIYWRLFANNGTHTAETYSSVSLDAPNAEHFIAFENLTEEKVIEWVESKLDVESIKTILDTQLEQFANPPIVTKQGPWNNK